MTTESESAKIKSFDDRWIGVIAAFVFLAAFFAFTQTEPKSWNDIARVAAIESLVERGTWSIDNSPWIEQTKDKVLLNGKFYSDKMPLLTLLAAIVYAPMHYGLGASLAPDCSPACAYSWLTLILIGIPTALTLWLYFDWALRQNMPMWIALLGMIAFGLGTMIFPFALVFNHHVPAAVVLFASFYLLTTRATPHRGWLITAGLLASLAISFDVLTAITALALFAIALARQRRNFFYFALGAAIPIIITVLLDYQIAGTILPAYMITSGYDYPGSAFPATFGGNGTPDDYATYAFRMFLGGRGLFAYNPLLLLALVGVILVMSNRQHALRLEAFSVTLCFIALAVYLALFTGNLGGQAYGERWFVPAIPMLFSFLFFAPPLNAPTWKNVAWLIFVPLLVLSIVSSVQGAQAPWLETPPPLQMTRDVNRFPIFGFKWNLQWP